MSRILFNGIQDNYTPEHSWNILAITCILGFASDLGDISLVLGYNLYLQYYDAINAIKAL